MKKRKQAFDPEKGFAIIAGVGARVEDTEIMQHTVNDAEMVARELMRKCALPERNVALLTGESAGKEKIMKAFREVAENSLDSPLEIFIFYFSGHGCVIDGEYYLVCNDTSNKNIREEGISSKEFISLLQNVNTQKLVVLLDCCHAEGMTDRRQGTLKDDLLTIDKPNRIVLSASHFEQVSFLSKPVSVFTFAFLEGLSGRHLSENEYEVTIFDLAMYVRERVAPLSRGRQKPQLNILQNNLTSNFVIASYPGGKPAKPVFDEAFRLLDADGKDIDISASGEKDEKFRNNYEWIKVNVDLGKDQNLLITVEGAVNTVNVNLLNIGELVSRLDEAEELKKDISATVDEKLRMQKSQRLLRIQKQIEEQTANIKNLATTLSRVEIKTERLKKAKEEFLKGNVQEADRLLNAEELISEQKMILEESGRIDEIAEDLKQKRIHNSTEFLVKARITLLRTDDQERFKKAEEYFRQSIESYKNTANLYEYGSFLRDQQRSGDAIKVFSECISVYENAPGDRSIYSPDIASAYNNLGDLLEKRNESESAGKCFHYALELYESCERKNPGTVTNELADSLNILGNYYQSHKMFDEAHKYYNRSLKIRTDMSEEVSDENKLPLAMLYNNFGKLFLETGDIEKASEFFENSVKLYEELAEINPQKYKPGLGLALSNFAFFYGKTDDFDKAKELFGRAIDVREDLVRSNPAEHLPGLATTFNNAGVFLQKSTNLKLAEDMFLRSLGIRQMLAETDPDAFIDDVAETMNNLAILNFKNGKLELADKQFEKLKSVYEILAKRNPGKYDLCLAKNYLAHGVLKYRTGMTNEGINSVNSAIEIARKYLPSAEAADLINSAETFIESIK